MIKEIAFVSYAVDDVARARNFYEKVLGLKPTNVWEGEDMAFIEYEIGGGALTIGKGAPNFSPGLTGATISLEVDDFDTTVSWLKENGVKFAMEPHDTGVCQMALIHDTEGNQIMIHKRKAK
jgi:predicted enzyme related to lactoylglutathione lyase